MFVNSLCSYVGRGWMANTVITHFECSWNWSLTVTKCPWLCLCSVSPVLKTCWPPSKWLMGVRTAVIHCEPFGIAGGFCCRESRVWKSRALHHCKLSSPPAAEDWSWVFSSSWWTSLTAMMRESMLCRVVLSNGWEVYQWELWVCTFCSGCRKNRSVLFFTDSGHLER